MDAIGQRVLRREPLATEGKSGASLERWRLDDGRSVIAKFVDPSGDWVMQATRDDGRVLSLWEEGFFDRLPHEVVHGILSVERFDDDRVVVMEDLTEYLLQDDESLRAAHPLILNAASSMHTRCREPATSLCSLTDYYRVLSPQVCSRFADRYEVPRLAIEGWSRVHEVVPREVSDAISSIHDDPSALAGQLLTRPSTLVHGDLKMANLGRTKDRVIVLDWGTLAMWAPPAVDYAWYLAVNGAAIGTERLDVLLEDVRRLPEHDEVALSLALTGVMAVIGWEKALGATSDDAAVRQRERAGLRWWNDQVLRALNEAGP